MQPWIQKGTTGSSSSSNKQTTFHYDQTLNNIPQSSSSGHTQGFRTNRQENEQEKEKDQEKGVEPFPQYRHHLDNQHLDGAEVLLFLNSTNYTDHVDGDDLRPDSMRYRSFQHQVDQFWNGFMNNEDIVNYIEQQTYIDDIYAIPVIGEDIRRVKTGSSEEKKKAINRLEMIRQHFIQKTHGDSSLAAQKASEFDWSQSFLDSFK